MLVSNKAKVLLLLLGLAFASISHAIGFGELKVYSYLGEPLYAEIELAGAEGLDESMLKVNLASAKDFVRAGIDRPFFLTFLAFQVITYDKNTYVVVRTVKPVQMPFLEFLVEISWPGGNLIKEYTILLDPPPSDLTKENRPKSARQMMEEQQGQGEPQSAIEEQMYMQKAQEQKAKTEATLTNVVREGNNKFSDQTFDMSHQQQKTELVPTEVPDVGVEYTQERQEYAKKLAEKAAVQKNESLLQGAVSDLETAKSELEPDLTVEQIIAAERKTGAEEVNKQEVNKEEVNKEEPVNFGNVIKPAGGGAPVGGGAPAAANRLANHTVERTAAIGAPTNTVVPAAAAPKSNHMYLGMILSLLLIGSGIAIAIKRGMLNTLLMKQAAETAGGAAPIEEMTTTSTETAASKSAENEVPFSDHPEEQLINEAMEEFVPAEDQEMEQIEITAIPEATPKATPPAAASPPTQESTEKEMNSVALEKFAEEFENINLDELAPPIEATEIKSEQATVVEVTPQPTPEPLPVVEQNSQPMPAPIPEEPQVPETTPAPLEPESPPLPEVPSPSPEPEQPEPKLSLQNEFLSVPTEEVQVTGPTLVQEKDSGLKLSEEGATLSLIKDDNTTTLDNSEAIAKKITLAKQYLDTGDTDAAKDLLREVIEVANDDQKLEAQLLLSSIV